VKTSAHIADGVLAAQLPKGGSVTARRIEVH